MKIAIFAHYDKNNIIDQYVIDYLKELKKYCEKIIFVSDCVLHRNELQKIDHLCYKIIAENHGEYDFGSYKRGFFAIDSQDLGKCEKVIFCNDSCYLIGSLQEVIKTSESCKWWTAFGLTSNQDCYSTHLQSYFFIVPRSIFLEPCFINFILSVKKEKTKKDIIEKYEIGFSKMLSENNFLFASLFSYESNPTLSAEYFRVLRKAEFPLLKTDFLKTNPLNIPNVEKKWKKGLSKQKIEIIENHLTRMIGKNRKHLNLSNFQSFLTKRPSSFLGKVLNFFISIRHKKGIWRIKVLQIPVIKFSVGE